MKIGIVLYDINQIGGIINHTEVLAKGFKELGHSVDLKMISVVKNRKDILNDIGFDNIEDKVLCNSESCLGIYLITLNIRIQNLL